MLREPQGLRGGAVKAGAGTQPGTGNVGAVSDPRCSTRRPGAKAQGQALLLHRGLAPQADGSFFWHGSWLKLAPRPPKPAVVALGKLSLLPSIQHRAAEHHRREQMGVGNY